jgi:cell shape-determining protein MreD
MKLLSYALLIVCVVPIQAVLLPHVSVWNVKPDLALIAVCLIGVLAGEMEGVLVGVTLGWIMSLFSAEDLGYSMLTKGGIGLLAGLAGRQIAHMTPMVLVSGLLVASCAVGLVMATSLRLSEEQNLWWALRAVVLPQACFDAVVGGTLYWLAWSRLNIERFVMDQHI